MSNIFGFIREIINPVKEIIDDVTTTDEERMELSNRLAEMQFQMQSKILSYETQLMEQQAAVIQSETTGESWLQRNWRPGTMVVFVGLVVAKWLGFTAPGVTEELELQLMNLIKIGLGGYIVGRSAEKVTKAWGQNATDKRDRDEDYSG